jgi:anhydro-N-acetylmuramic acid kinase
MSNRWIIGLASGSSVSGVSAALVEIEGIGLEIRARPILALKQSYARDLSDLIRRGSSPESSDAKQICLLHRLLGETFAAAARQAADRASFSLQNLQCIGCPGHIICHEPDGRFPSTLTLGMPAVIAERTGVTVVSDFDSRDLAVGGRGTAAEILPDYLLFGHPQQSRFVIHLGGVASVVALPSGCRPQDGVGLGITPCNQFLDGLMRRLTGGKEVFDSGGKYGVQGKCLEPLLERWFSHPYFVRRQPKSIPKPGFSDELILQALQFARQENCSINDVLCTATHFIARNIGTACRRFLSDLWPADRVLLTGGGTRNGLLWRLLEQQLDSVPMEKSDQYGIPCDGRKAIHSAVLAGLTLDGTPANLSRHTGSSGFRLLGSLTPGSPANWAQCLEWMAAQAAPMTAVED